MGGIIEVGVFSRDYSTSKMEIDEEEEMYISDLSGDIDDVVMKNEGITLAQVLRTN